MTTSETSTGVEIDITEILSRIPHRYPFLLVDRAEDFKPSESIVGVKCVTFNEPFFEGHFPGYPVMPGVLIVEALAQTGAILMSKSLNIDIAGKVIYFMSIDGVRFRSPVRPGDVLKLHVEVTRARGDIFKFKGVARVNGKVAAEAEFAAMSADVGR
ncbi:3-hydroxyacyl-ACP dehydratase FabZ [Caulobacter sp. SLTY]|uniref:3-hydroxyacyl-ACP dehydratase FabZ n=1 Tax=Caulobacter sp. SLTY TaxID=2683262 RepID=UPI001411BCAF|nr:3-hydroxyacyl-ACP dehydratase FabZ [Caulobacter sp. SLTY]NBB17231.1 3-hydroxyacyl-ACP dehydratase FabZ [Caulobacter sp. SLTY]